MLGSVAHSLLAKDRSGLRIAAAILLFLSACGGKGHGTGSGPGTAAESPVLTASSGSGSGSGSSGPATPGTESSAGGGNAVVCFEPHSIAAEVDRANLLEDKYLANIVSIEALDLYAARTSFPAGHTVKVAAPMPNETPEQYADRMITRIDHVNYYFGNQGIRTAKIAFDKSKVHYSESAVRRIRDEQYRERLPEGCTLSTVAVQMLTPVPLERKDPLPLPTLYAPDAPPPFDPLEGKNPNHPKPNLTLDKRLYFHEKHSVESRGTLLLHEYIYYWTHGAGASFSRGAREVIPFLIIEATPAYTDVQFTRTLKRVMQDLVNGPSTFYWGGASLTNSLIANPFSTKAQGRLESVLAALYSDFENTLYPGHIKKHPEFEAVVKAAAAITQKKSSAYNFDFEHPSRLITSKITCKTLPKVREIVEKKCSERKNKIAALAKSQISELTQELRSSYSEILAYNELEPRVDKQFFIPQPELDRINQMVLEDLIPILANNTKNAMTRFAYAESNAENEFDPEIPCRGACNRWSEAMVEAVNPTVPIPAADTSSTYAPASTSERVDYFKYLIQTSLKAIKSAPDMLAWHSSGVTFHDIFELTRESTSDQDALCQAIGDLSDEPLEYFSSILSDDCFLPCAEKLSLRLDEFSEKRDRKIEEKHESDTTTPTQKMRKKKPAPTRGLR